MNNPDITMILADKRTRLVLMHKSYHQDSFVIKGHLDSNIDQEVPLDSDKKKFLKS